ncbi:50S ribosomal protein L11 methyltransferase [Acuticoccus sediminis]|uniref:50S ribosomal protein L11 methyltransferase n=1 Tax=Acuticoccus sediminis TaxID=2184697 RepID=A0A8B2NS70_9HYPH|nr:50S ribosomal protein L11 methyltransferase [Acuticoccus sediminis]RAH99961.1 50S ribosomal protein L11 methyltransferase [Acuticoccus sediminis]
MVTRAFATLGVGDQYESIAEQMIATLDVLVDDGEPILSAYRPLQDGEWLIDVMFVDKDADARARWLAEARELLPELPDFEEDPVAERDWVAESQKALHPIHAGRFVVFGSHDRDKMVPTQWRIEIDAGRAFGTAHHASTRGCLIALEKLAKRRPLTTVADVGTGTGVLAIAADRLGARAVAAGDIDPVSVEVARRNIAVNRTHRPIPVVVKAGPFAIADTVIANILARPLIAMANDLALATGRTLVLSGLRTAHVRPVKAAYRARGLVVADQIIIEDWATLTLERPLR